mgnify:CR=1 FL=1
MSQTGQNGGHMLRRGGPDEVRSGGRACARREPQAPPAPASPLTCPWPGGDRVRWPTLPGGGHGLPSELAESRSQNSGGDGPLDR